MHMTLAHLQCKNVMLSTTATKQLAHAQKKMWFSILPNNGASSRIWAYGFYSFHVEYNSQQYCSKKHKLPNDASKCFCFGLHQQSRSILFLKLVSTFLCPLKPSHSTPSFFLFGIFGDKSTSPEAKQNRRNDAASLRHVSCYRSNNMNIFAFRVTGHDVVMPAQ